LQNADVRGDGSKSSPRVTPADAQDIFLSYLRKEPIAGSCSGTQRSEASASPNAKSGPVTLTINDFEIVPGQDVHVPVIVAAGEEIRAFGFDLAFSPGVLRFIRVERADLTADYAQLDAEVMTLAEARRGRVRLDRRKSRILRVGGFGVGAGRPQASGVLVTLVFRATGRPRDESALEVTGVYDDIQNARIQVPMGRRS